MALEWENVFNFSNQIYPFDHHQQLQLQHQENDELFLSLETELLCSDSVPPTLLPPNDPLLNPPFHNHLDHHHYDHQNLINHDMMTINECNSYLNFDFLPPLLLPCFQPNSIPENQQPTLPSENLPNFDNSNVDVITNPKTKVVSAQSRAARERRRKITEKTQELGKLVPGGSKMNTAQMLKAAFKYVKFLHAQLGILQSMQTFIQKSEQKVNLDKLPLLASNVVQEKLYTNEKCLVPLDLLPTLQEHCNFDINIPNPK